ncbi:MAG TPA: hybrid sensor histidine kinase/response regulator [Steroidobacteraceae bacterium]|nr:hybrid sensor histidine kinase/response regulator [Steroidobacteraceae bacterium]
MSPQDLSQSSMLDLFRMEVEAQAQVLTSGLLALERDPKAADQLEICMRAAHSLKGAARIVGLDAGVSITHAMEDCFVAAQHSRITLRQGHIDELLHGVDLLQQMAGTAEKDMSRWEAQKLAEVAAFVDVLNRAAATPAAARELDPAPVNSDKPRGQPGEGNLETLLGEETGEGAQGRVLRVTAENLNRLLGLAAESLVESRGFKSFADSLLRLKHFQYGLLRALDRLREQIPQQRLSEPAQAAFGEAQRRALECQQYLAQRLVEIDAFDRRAAHLSHRLYDGALACHMRPFADGVQGFPRMVRDLARMLGKQLRLDITGQDTQVDRNILERLEAPLGHLLRNALDHGIESPEERLVAGKSAEALLTVEARHNAGRLQVTVADDGRGIDLDRLRATIIERKLSNAETAAQLSEAELLEFLFLPGFSLKEEVTDISGRGVGLDVVQNVLKQIRGTVRITTGRGQGTRFALELPLTLSVARTLLVEVGAEAYAVPLAYIRRALKLAQSDIKLLEGRAHFNLDGRSVGLVTAHQLLGVAPPQAAAESLAVIVLGDATHVYGLTVDRFLGERELVVQSLDPRLGKIKDIAAGALMEDGSPALILDVEDVIRSIEKLASAGSLSGVATDASGAAQARRKRVLVVEDSFTVRELERKLLVNSGFEVEVAVDGMDGWNAARTSRFDLVITDVDMPRMDGIELVTLIKKDPHVKSLPVMIVSYKDRPEDRRRGLDAGADYYLAKGSFHDEALLHAVVDLIGAAQP